MGIKIPRTMCTKPWVHIIHGKIHILYHLAIAKPLSDHTDKYSPKQTANPCIHELLSDLF